MPDNRADDQQLDEQLEASHYVQSPDGAIYPVDAQGRSDLVARGYRDVTDSGGAQKFREQNEAAAKKSNQGAASAPAQPSAEARPSAASPRPARAASGDQADDTAKA